MNWLLKALGWPDDANTIAVSPAHHASAPAIMHGATTSYAEEVAAHVARFQQALEQSAPDDPSRAELNRWLAYYTTLHDANALHPGQGG